MSDHEGTGHRKHIDGDEIDYLTSRRSRGNDRHQITNHGLRKKVKTAHSRRTRRSTRQALRSGEEG